MQLGKQIQEARAKENDPSNKKRVEGDAHLAEAGSLCARGDFAGAKTMLAKAREAYAGSKVDMSGVCYDMEKRIEDAEKKASLRKLGDDALQRAMEYVSNGQYADARVALVEARSAYEAAGHEVCTPVASARRIILAMTSHRSDCDFARFPVLL